MTSWLRLATTAHSVGLQVYLMPFLNSRDGDHYITSFNAWYLESVDGEKFQGLDEVSVRPAAGLFETGRRGRRVDQGAPRRQTKARGPGRVSLIGQACLD